MNINIGDEKGGKRPVTVTDADGTEIYSGTTATTEDAHKAIKALRKADWDAEALAEQTKAATKKEKAEVEKGKADAEPKK